MKYVSHNHTMVCDVSSEAATAKVYILIENLLAAASCSHSLPWALHGLHRGGVYRESICSVEIMHDDLGFKEIYIHIYIYGETLNL